MNFNLLSFSHFQQFSAIFATFECIFAKPPCTEKITAGSVKTDEENSILRKLTNQVLPKLPKKLATPKSDCCDANVAWLGATRWHDSGNFDRFTEGYVWVHDYLHPGSVENSFSPVSQGLENVEAYQFLENAVWNEHPVRSGLINTNDLATWDSFGRCLTINPVSDTKLVPEICAAETVDKIICEVRCSDACFSNPCKKGASCKRIGDPEGSEYECDCPGNFGGDCDICKEGYQGVGCDIDINECDLSPCVNDGVCQNLNADYRCTNCAPFSGKNCHCSDGFTGENCETQIDECSSDPCGLPDSTTSFPCINGVLEWTCDCTGSHKTGKFCHCSSGLTGSTGRSTILTDYLNLVIFRDFQNNFRPKNILKKKYSEKKIF